MQVNEEMMVKIHGMMLAFALAAGAGFSAAGSDLMRVAAFELETGLRGADYWAGIPRHPAVVNAVGREQDGTWMSLSGTWEFTNLVHGCGKRTTRFKPGVAGPFAEKFTGGRTIQVPGCWEAQGVGGEGMGVPHLCADNAPKKIRGSWTGEGFYRREVAIPSDWAGRRIWMKIGGIRARGWVYVDDHAVAMTDSYAGAWKYEITGLVRPGKTVRVIVDADNVVGARNAQPSATHRWGGIVRDIELEATPEVFIDDAWVRGDFDRREAQIKVTVDGGGGQRNGSYSLRATVDGESVETALSPSGSAYDLHLALRTFRPWSPERPNLYWATIELLKDGEVVHVRKERFGVRKLEVRGTRFFLNDKPFFFRGFGDDSVYPITGITPPSREYHLAHLKKARAAGFNYVRLHTHCEIPEYFEAADEAGIIVQPELSYYLDEPEDYFDYDPVRDAVERWVAFRRHPSYAINCSGNEGTLGPDAGRIMYGFLKKLDPDRLVQDEDGGSPETRDHLAADRADFCSGPLNTWERGSFNPKRAFICHEYLNLSVKQDSRLEKSFTGVWMPTVFRDERGEWLKAFGLAHDWGDRLQNAQHALQKYWQKNGIEHARKDPHCGGYCYWTIVDVAVRNEEKKTCTAQGLLDPFWNEKIAGQTLAEFATFNSPVCLLLDTENKLRDFTGSARIDKSWWIPGKPEETNRVYVAGETIHADFLLAHYGEEPLRDAMFAWKLTGADGTVYAKGEKPLGICKADTVRSVHKASIPVPCPVRPTKAALVATLTSRSSRSISNSWYFWFFPKTDRRAVSERTVVCAPDSPESAAARNAGKNLMLVSNQSGAPNCRLGWWWLGKQVGTAFIEHDIFGDFPQEPYLAPLHFRMIREGAKLPVEGFSEKDFIAVGETDVDARLYLAAKTRSDGGREVFVAGLDIMSDRPESIVLWNNILDWLEARPIATLTAGNAGTGSAGRGANFRIRAATPSGTATTTVLGPLL